MIKNKNAKPRIIFGAGGTGGHLFPAQALANQLSNQCECLFVGGLLSKNSFFDKKTFTFSEIAAAPLSLHPQKVFKLLKGIKESVDIINSFNPDLVIGFGSYFTFPLLAASALKKIPIFLHEQNALPGRVNRLFSPFAKLTAISFPHTRLLLNGKNIQEVRFPLRIKKKEKNAWEFYSFEQNRPTLLVFGGSQGAKMLNYLFMEVAISLPQHIQILHFTGDKVVSEKAKTLYEKLGRKYVVKEFEDNMEYAFAASSLALTRAGASTIAELIDAEIPALLIPFPHAKDNHQYENAKHFVENVRGGEFLFQEEITVDILKETLLQLLEEKEKIRNTIKKYKKKQNLKDFSQLILQFFEEEKVIK